MQYEVHEINDRARFRVIPHDCGRESCDTCQEGAFAWLFNSDDYNPRRWVVAGLIESEFVSPFDDVPEEEKDELCDLYGRLAAIFGNEWDFIERDWHAVYDRAADLMVKVSANPPMMDALRKLEPVHVQYFKVPELESSKVAIDRIKTLLAFPQLYDPKKAKKKKKKKEDK